MTPLDAVTTHLAQDGEFDCECVAWLRSQDYEPTDIGAYAKSEGVPKTIFVPALKHLSDSYRKLAVKGYMARRTTEPLPKKVPDFGGWKRPEIVFRDDSAESAAEAWGVFVKANEPKQMFSFANTVAWVKATAKDPAVLVAGTADRFLWLHHHIVKWRKVDEKKGIVPAEPPSPLMKNMLADPHCPLPPLVGVRSAPVVGPGGALTDHWGYDEPTKLFIWPQGLDVPFIPSRPTAADVAKARHLIEVELLGDFPFDDEASKTHAIAALLHPFVRPMIAGATPLHLIDKPVPGTGAGLLTDAITFPALGRSPDLTTLGKLEDETRFALFAALRTGPAVIVLDNINEPLKSTALASMITAPDTVSGRVIRSSVVESIPVRNLWIASGNNVAMTDEMARRTLLIRMDANMEHPEEGREFRHPHLMEWATEHRSELVWAALILVQAWVAAGRPRGSKTKGSFASWAETMSGILEIVGIGGFMENNDKLRALADIEGDAWRSFVTAWFQCHGTAAVGAGDLQSLAEQHLDRVVDWGNPGRSRATKWGTVLRSKRDSVIAGYKITHSGTKHGAAQWRLVPMEGSTRGNSA